MNKIEFTNRYYYLALTTTLFLLVFYHGILATIDGNPLGYLPAIIALLLVFFIALGHELTKLLLYIWAAIFMIFGNSIKLVFKYLTQSSNEGHSFQIDSILLNLLFVVIGLLAIIGGRQFIVEKDLS